MIKQYQARRQPNFSVKFNDKEISFWVCDVQFCRDALEFLRTDFIRDTLSRESYLLRDEMKGRPVVWKSKNRIET
jgi:hypothetical protein